MTTSRLAPGSLLVPAPGPSARRGRRWARRNPLQEVREADRQRGMLVMASAAGVGTAVIAVQGALVLFGG